MVDLNQLQQRLRTSLPSSTLGSAGTQGERVAVFLKMGLDGYEQWQAARPWLFWGGIAGAVASAAMLAKRRRTAEAYPLYLTTLALSAAAAWVARPRAEAPPPPGQPPVEGPGLLAWIDAKRAQFAAADPRWVATTIARARKNPDIAPVIKATPILGLIA